MFNRVVAFLPGYSTDKTRGFDIGTIPGNRISDLMYCFAGFVQQGETWLPAFPEPHDTGPGKKHNLARLIALKTQWPALNIVISIGGWNHSHQGDPTFKTTPAFSAISATPESRQAFVSACIALFIAPTHPVIGPLFGGIDIDWEFPVGGDRPNLVALLQEFRNQLDTASAGQGRPLTLSCCFGAGDGGPDISPLAGVLTWFNLMTYLAHRPDHTPQNQVTDFGAPLFSSPDEPQASASWTIDGVVSRFLSSGIPAEKLQIGINTYARTYEGVADMNHGLYQPYTGPGPGSFGRPGGLEYKELMANYLPRYESHWDDVTKSSYLYSPAERIWMTFDSVASVAARVEYANEKGLGGLLLWEIGSDAPSAESQPALPGTPALLDAIPFGVRSFSNKDVLRAASGTAPALAFVDGKAFMACRHGGKDNLQVMFSSDDGSTFGGSVVFSDTSDAAPALAAHNGNLMIAWKGSGNDNLSVAQVSLTADSQGKLKIGSLTNKVSLAETSDAAPALGSHDGLLFLAWKGSGSSNLSVMFSSDNGASFEGKHVSQETSDAAPALATHRDLLKIAWKGSGNDNLSVADVSLFGNTQGGFGIEGLTGKVVLGDTTDTAPALASDQRRLFLAWKGSGNSNLSVMFSEDGGAGFGGKFISTESSDTAPALASDGSQIQVAWKGSGNDTLNAAQLAFF